MKMIIANWKNYPQDLKTAINLFEGYKALSKRKNAFYMIAPPLPFLPIISLQYKGKLMSLGAQKIDAVEKEASTGLTNAKHLRDLGCAFTLVGHSEQRNLGLENQDIKRRFYDAYGKGLAPVFIVGEKQRDKQGNYLKDVRSQIRVVLSDFPKNKACNFIMAYEPVWAVGANRAPKQDEIAFMAIYIKKELVKILGENRAKKVPILYGGSVNEHNIQTIMDTEVVDGVLLGRASCDIAQMAKIDSLISDK